MKVERKLRIGIDAHIVGAGKGGVERFLREMCHRLPELTPEHNFILFCSGAAIANKNVLSSDHVELVRLPFANPLIERAIVLPWLARRYSLDILLVQRLSPWAMGRCKVALAVHDLTPIKFPLQYRGLTNSLIRLLTRSSVKRSDVVLSPSLVVTREISDWVDEPIDKFHAYYNGVDSAQFTSERPESGALEKLGVDRSFLFTSGALERRKNVETMMRAMRYVPLSTCSQLVVAGSVRDAAYARELETLANEPGISGRVRLLNFVSEEVLIELYGQALGFVSASRDEGFNMPILEAMASGTATLCSDIPVHRELFDGASLFFPADSDQQLARKICALLGDRELRLTLVKAGMERASRFTWNSTAVNVRKALESVF